MTKKNQAVEEVQAQATEEMNVQASEEVKAQASQENEQASNEELDNKIAVQVSGLQVAVSNERYDVVVDVDGKYKRKAKFKAFSSVEATTREQKIRLLNLLESEDEGLPMKEHIGEKFSVADVIFRPYDKVNEDTGYLENGVLTYLLTDDGRAFVTSSKSVYFTMQGIINVFGEPHWNEDDAPLLQIVLRKGTEHQYTDVKLIG